MPRKTVSKRRTRVKARARAKRVSRRRKGGECGDITQHEDNYHCVEAGCDPFECARYHKASMPHPDVVDQTALLNAKIAKINEMKNYARINRQINRQRKRASQKQISRALSNLVQPPTDEQMRKAQKAFSKYAKGLPSSDSEGDSEGEW